jgi:hypothetical protein
MKNMWLFSKPPNFQMYSDIECPELIKSAKLTNSFEGEAAEPPEDNTLSIDSKSEKGFISVDRRALLPNTCGSLTSSAPSID